MIVYGYIHTYIHIHINISCQAISNIYVENNFYICLLTNVIMGQLQPPPTTAENIVANVLKMQLRHNI